MFREGDKVEFQKTQSYRDRYETLLVPVGTVATVKFVQEDTGYVAVEIDEVQPNFPGEEAKLKAQISDLLGHAVLVSNTRIKKISRKKAHKVDADTSAHIQECLDAIKNDFAEYQETDNISLIQDLIDYVIPPLVAELKRVIIGDQQAVMSKKATVYGLTDSTIEHEIGAAEKFIQKMCDEYKISEKEVEKEFGTLEEVVTQILCDKYDYQFKEAFTVVQDFFKRRNVKKGNEKTMTGPKGMPDPSQHNMFVNPVKYEPALTNIGKRRFKKKVSIKYNSKHNFNIF